MTPGVILADGIDLPLVLLYGLAVLVPLMLFQVAVEGGILSRVWRLPFKGLIRPIFLANCWSLLAGIPTKVFNAGIYSRFLPTDLPAYFARYGYVVATGTGVYFVITVLVEVLYLWRWLKQSGYQQTRSRLWLGVVIANTATYGVLGPLHYLATRPIQDVREFTSDTRWAKQPPTQIIYIDSKTGQLKAVLSDGSAPRTLVPIAVTNYLVTSNLETVLFQGQDGVRKILHSRTGETKPADAEGLRALASAAMFGPLDREDWGGTDSIKGSVAWAEPGLGNSLRVYRTNDILGSLVRVAANPGLLHLADFRFGFCHPAFISDANECLFQSRNAIYLLDVSRKRVGRVADGNHFVLLTPLYSKSP